jgi:cysteine-rich repeat protein
VILGFLFAGCSDDDTASTASCGNGIAEGDEVCDGADLRGNDCFTRGFHGGGTLSCLADCSDFDVGGCNADAQCGNGSIEIGEVCDATNLDGQSCTSLGFDGGTLTCLTDCSGFDTTNCTGSGPQCGNGSIEIGEVCDATNLDGQSCTSLGFDGGTLACLADCSGFDTTNCTGSGPQCGNDAREGDEICDGFDLDDQSCASLGFDGGTLACLADCSGFDTTNCTDVEPQCANGQVESGEDCDDNNTDDGDGCDANCQLETGWSCTGSPSNCNPICGDGLIVGPEECEGSLGTCTDAGYDMPGVSACTGNCQLADPSICCANPSWQIETVDSVDDVGTHTSLVLDSDDHPHISYYDSSSYDLKYARFDGSNWHIEVAANAGNSGETTSLALDSNERPHIAYHYDNHWANPIRNHQLRYAHFDGTSWQTETVDSAGNAGWGISLALDADDHAHISYYEKNDDDLRYAHYDGTDWQVVTLDNAGNKGLGTSLALDSAQQPHISYVDYTNHPSDYTLRYAHLDGSSWIIEDLSAIVDIGSATSLELDTMDRPHIGYYDFAGHEVAYVHYDGSSWQAQNIGPARAYYLSLKLDGAQRPHLSHRTGTTTVANLGYAYFDGTGWSTDSVDGPSSDVGDHNALALDSASLPHISYFDNENNDLKYAHLACP